jgi:hypothetical protein
MRGLLLGAALTSLVVVAGGLGRAGDVADSGIWHGSPPPGLDVIEAEVHGDADFLPLNGTLLRSGPDRLLLMDSYSGERFEVVLAADVRICRRECDAAWSNLRLGDRISGLSRLPLGAVHRQAAWIVANGAAGYAEVVGVNGDELLVTELQPDRELETLKLVIGPHTLMDEGNGEPKAVSTIETGDRFYFTGTSDAPSSRADLGVVVGEGRGLGAGLGAAALGLEVSDDLTVAG